MNRLLVGGLGVILCATPACDDPESPTAPPPLEVSTPASVSATGDAPELDLRVALGAAIEDASIRVLPALGTPEETADLMAALGDLADAIEKNRGSLHSMIRRAEQAVDALEDTVKEDAGRSADLAAVRLVVERADDLDD